MSHNTPYSSVLYQYLNLTKTVIFAIPNKPDDQIEWSNILKLMFHLRQVLSCSSCSKLLIDPCSPINQPCHSLCGECRRSNQIHLDCPNCRNAKKLDYQSMDRFRPDSNLNFLVQGFINLSKFLIAKGMVSKWSSLRIVSSNKSISFDMLTSDGLPVNGIKGVAELGETETRKKIKEKEHLCRCKAPGNLTCRGQRCQCYSEGKLKFTPFC